MASPSFIEAWTKVSVFFLISSLSVPFKASFKLDAEKKAIEDSSSNLKEALKGTDNEDIKKKTETLVQASMKLGEAIYKSQEKKPDSSSDGDKNDEGKKDDNVVDADFEEVKEENKDQDKEEEKEKSA